jgi:WD40 repeat protein
LGGKRSTLSFVWGWGEGEVIVAIVCSRKRAFQIGILRLTRGTIGMQVFFLDTLKLFLSLYGHKLPVLAMDISSDSTLLVSGGADKNIRIWGLDFGDCHRSIFAHESNITQARSPWSQHLDKDVNFLGFHFQPSSSLGLSLTN